MVGTGQGDARGRKGACFTIPSKQLGAGRVNSKPTSRGQGPEASRGQVHI